MVETAHSSAGTNPDDSGGPTRRVSFEQTTAELDRLADAAAEGPARVELPGRNELVVMSADAFDRMNARPRSMYASELSERHLHLLRTQPISDEGLAFEHEGDLIERG